MTKDYRIYTLATVFNIILSKFVRWNQNIYMQGRHPWNLETKCIIVDDEDTEYGETEIQFAVENNFFYGCNVQQAKSIINSVRKGLPEYTSKHLLIAFNHYFEYDAFIKLDNLKNLDI